MNLYLVQHGEAVPKEIDADRPLSEKGASDVNNIAVFLNDAEIYVAHIYHSGKTRARQTAEIVANSLGYDDPVTKLSGINPNDAVEEFAKQLSEYSNDTMLVGHLPFMARLVAYLITGDPDRVLTVYQPGSIVCLTRNEDDNWQIAWMLRPELF